MPCKDPAPNPNLGSASWDGASAYMGRDIVRVRVRLNAKFEVGVK